MHAHFLYLTSLSLRGFFLLANSGLASVILLFKTSMMIRLAPQIALPATTPTTILSSTSGISRRLMGSNTRTSSASTAERFFSGCALLKSTWRAITRMRPSRAAIARRLSLTRAVYLRLKK